MLLVQEKSHNLKDWSAAHTVGSAHAVTRSPGASPQVKHVDPSAGMDAPLSYGNDALPPVELGVGETREEFDIKAGAKLFRRYILHGSECVSWTCSVLDGYTIDLCAKVSVHRGSSKVMLGGRPLNLVGVHSSRVVSEKERGISPSGYLDLGSEHKGCVDIGGPDGSAVLSLEIDNSFSFFTAKNLRLRITKTLQGQELKPQSRSTALEQQEQAVIAPTAAMNSSKGSAAGSPLRSDETPFGAICAPVGSTVEDPLCRLRCLLAEALGLCPSDAPSLREHLRAAQTHVSEHATNAEREHAPASEMGSPASWALE